MEMYPLRPFTEIFLNQPLLGIQFNKSYTAGLDPHIKAFLIVVTIIGPLSIVGIIFLLKKIEKEHPDRIRWH